MKKDFSKVTSLRLLAIAFLTASVAMTSLSANAFYGSIGDNNNGGGYDNGGFNNGRGGGYPGPGGYPGRPGGPGRGGYGSQRGDLRDYREVERLVNLIYQAALFRDADRVGLDAFSRQVYDRGAQGLFDSARMIGSSPEFAQLVQGTGSKRVVYNIYRVFFNRRPDPSGLCNWSEMLDQGRGGDALDGIVRSQEFYQNQL